jgi:membrane-bound serine protease (ClpP class)
MGEFTSLIDLLVALLRLFGLEESAIFPAIALLVLFFIIAVPIGLLSQGRRVTTGKAGMVGEEGEAITDLAPGGKVYIHSEYWNAVARLEIQKGTKVRVVAVDGMTLSVEQVS